MNKKIHKIRDIIIDHYKPDKIFLFGSHARGNPGIDSDVDILVVSDREQHLPRYKRGLNVRLKLADISIPKDILFYTHDDLEQWKDVRMSFAWQVLQEGVLLYEK